MSRSATGLVKLINTHKCCGAQREASSLCVDVTCHHKYQGVCEQYMFWIVYLLPHRGLTSIVNDLHHLPELLSFHNLSCLEVFFLISLSHKDYLMNLHEIFRRHRYGPLPHLQVQCYHGYQSMLFLCQHICNTLSNLFTYCNITQKLFNQYSWNFQGK